MEFPVSAGQRVPFALVVIAMELILEAKRYLFELSRWLDVKERLLLQPRQLVRSPVWRNRFDNQALNTPRLEQSERWEFRILLALILEAAEAVGRQRIDNLFAFGPLVLAGRYPFTSFDGIDVWIVALAPEIGRLPDSKVDPLILPESLVIVHVSIGDREQPDPFVLISYPGRTGDLDPLLRRRGIGSYRDKNPFGFPDRHKWAAAHL